MPQTAHYLLQTWRARLGDGTQLFLHASQTPLPSCLSQQTALRMVLAADMEGEAAEAVGEYKVLSRGTLGLKSGTISLNDVSLPDRSADGVDVFALNHVKL